MWLHQVRPLVQEPNLEGKIREFQSRKSPMTPRRRKSPFLDKELRLQVPKPTLQMGKKGTGVYFAIWNTKRITARPSWMLIPDIEFSETTRDQFVSDVSKKDIFSKIATSRENVTLKGVQKITIPYCTKISLTQGKVTVKNKPGTFSKWLPEPIIQLFQNSTQQKLYQDYNFNPGYRACMFSNNITKQIGKGREIFNYNQIFSNAQVDNNANKRLIKQFVSFLPSCLIKLTNESGEIFASNGLIDTGSTSSFISKKLAKFMELNVENRGSELVTLFGGKSEMHPKNFTTVTILDKDAHEVVTTEIQVMDSVATLTFNPFLEDIWPCKCWQNKHEISCLHKLPSGSLADHFPRREIPAEILIGSDLIPLIMEPRSPLTLYSKEAIMMATFTKFGVTLAGKAQLQVWSSPDPIYCHHQSSIELLEPSQLWQLEGFPDGDNVSLSPEDIVAESTFLNTIAIDPETGKYMVGLPLKEDRLPIGGTYDRTYQRFLRMERGLLKSEPERKAYVEAMEELIEKGIVKEYTGPLDCNPEEYGLFPGEEAFLAQSLVFKTKNGKFRCRVCFDASQKNAQGFSLNSALIPGPKTQKELLDILLRVRQSPFVAQSDVAAYFHQISVRKEYAELLKFFYRPPGSNQPIKVFYWTRLLFGLTCSPFLSNRSLTFHCEPILQEPQHKYFEICQQTDKNRFIDDQSVLADTEGELEKLCADAIALYDEAGLSLGKFVSNSNKVLRTIPKELLKDPLVDGCLDPTKADANILGTNWNVTRDTLTFSNFSKLQLEIEQKETVTKREMHSFGGKIFDLLGFLAPFLLWLKLLIQNSWKLKLKWDDKLPETDVVTLKQWATQLPLLSKIQLPRYFSTNNCKIVGMCDSSLQAMGVVFYVVNERSSHFLMAKSKLVPYDKAVSIPKLELQAMYLLARMADYLASLLKIPKEHFELMSDSMVALHWITKNPQTLQVFVSNRCKFIKNSGFKNWYYVASAFNAADCLTKPTHLKKLAEDEWLSGPPFLLNDSIFQPIHISKLNLGEKDLIDSKKEQKPKMFHTFPTQYKFFMPFKIDNIPLHQRYSSWTKLLRVTATVLRAIKRMRKEGVEDVVSPQLLFKAKNLWIKWSQMEDFKNEIMALLSNSQIDKNSKILAFTPYLDKYQTLRAKGRLEESLLPDTQKFPWILSHESALMPLIVSWAHEITFHSGSPTTLAKIREEYFFIKGNRTVLSWIRKLCQKCRRFDQPTAQPIEASLPWAKMANSGSRIVYPFEFCACDIATLVPYRRCFCKALKTKVNEGNKVTEVEPHPVGTANLLVIHCLTYGLCCLELSFETQEAPALIQAFRRASNRMGQFRYMVSDGAPNLKACKAVMEPALEEMLKQVQAELANQGTIWHINVPLSPNTNPSERLIRTIKRALNRTIGKLALDATTMMTLISSLENQINSRPLIATTHSEGNPTKIIRPIDFLRPLGTITQVPDFYATSHQIPAQARMRENLKFKEHLVNTLHTTWKKLYLTSLLQRKNWLQTRNLPPISEGHVVILTDESKSARDWDLAIIHKIITGRDGLPRSALVRTEPLSKKKPVKMLTRAMKALIPLESSHLFA